MDFKDDTTYSAPVERVFEFFCDPEATTARYEAAGHTEVEVLENGADGDDWVTRTKRVVTIDLPGFARKVLSPSNTMTQTDRWGPAHDDGSRSGTWEVDVDGAPVRTQGTMRLEPAPDGQCRHLVTGSLDVKVPLIGGRVAKWAGGDAKKELDHEFTFNAERLS